MIIFSDNSPYSELVKNPKLLNLFSPPIALLRNENIEFANSSFLDLFNYLEQPVSNISVKQLFNISDINSFQCLNKILECLSDKNNLEKISGQLKLNADAYFDSKVTLKYLESDYFLLELDQQSNSSDPKSAPIKTTAILDNLTTSCCIVTDKLKILEANKEFLSAFDCDIDKYVDRNLKDVFAITLINEIKEGIQNIQRDGLEFYDIETEHYNEFQCNNTFYKVDLSRIGETNQFLINFTDQSHQIELLKKLTEAEEKASKIKSIFVAQMSHEIRTPINAILSFANLLKEDLREYITPELNTGFEVIKRGGERIVRTIDLILDMSEVMTDTHDYLPNSFDLISEVVSDVFLKYKKIATERDVECTLTSEVSSHSIFCDQYMVKQIFSNVLDNAVKFTSEGKISVNISRDKNNNLSIEVEDTGIGIRDEYLSDIFEPFSQEDVGVNRRYEGNGIGLTLAKMYCDINNIDLYVSSEAGKGTKVTLKFKNLPNSSEGFRHMKAINL